MFDVDCIQGLAVRGVPLADETQNVNNSALWHLDLAAAIHGVSEL